MFQPERFDRIPLYENSKFAPIPDIDAACDSYDMLSWELASGDAVAGHFLTLHSAPGNHSADREGVLFSSHRVSDDPSPRFQFRKSQ